MALDAAAQMKLKDEWDALWDDAKTKRKALEAGIRGGVSDERRGVLAQAYQAAHKAWWDVVSNFKP